MNKSDLKHLMWRGEITSFRDRMNYVEEMSKLWDEEIREELIDQQKELLDKLRWDFK